jgi:hypothetical protein
MIASPTDYICGGFFLDHPAKLTLLPRSGPNAAVLGEMQRARRFLRPSLFADPDALLAFARTLPSPPPLMHGLALPGEDADRLLDGEDTQRIEGTPAILRLLQRRMPAPTLTPVRAGWNVLGLLGEQCLSWREDRSARAIASRLGLPPEQEFLADREQAMQLADGLNDDDLGSPVYWLPWWHSLLAALPN